ncbi:MAG: hypothetical protein J6T70_09470 [Bacteroidales bacterium]|nr:hypothetical protein [Bacteroidales bacterium]
MPLDLNKLTGGGTWRDAAKAAAYKSIGIASVSNSIFQSCDNASIRKLLIGHAINTNGE